MEEEIQLETQEEGCEIVEEEKPTLDIGKIVVLSGVPRFHTLRHKGRVIHKAKRLPF